MAISPLTFPTPQAYSGGADFSPLAQLPQIAQAAQDRANQQAALAQLGTDPTANAQMLIKSGDPSLASLGLRLAQQQTEQQRLAANTAEQIRQFNLGFGIRQAEEKRAVEAAERDTPEWRQAHAAELGLDPNAPSTKAWVAGGKYPSPRVGIGQPFPVRNEATGKDEYYQMSSEGAPVKVDFGPGMTPLSPEEMALAKKGPDRKAIETADAQTQAARSAITSMDRLENLSKASFHLGLLTGPVADVASFLPEGMGQEAGVATKQLQRGALQQMIGNVRASFGSQPSNKEDAWLLKAQVAIEGSREDQRQTIDEGKRLMQERLQYNQQRARDLRDPKKFYSPEYVPFEPKTEITELGARPTPAATAAAPESAAATTPAPAHAPSQFTEGQTAINKKTGQRKIYRNGQWVDL